ncbi:MAG: methyltransferase domain-containing protein [Deltaproteobacteria bacterium]|nr:methyltransferase domain-containing protein [Deltaproteobacteria bacterium]
MIKRLVLKALGFPVNLLVRAFPLDMFDDYNFIQLAYHFILRRPPDEEGWRYHLTELSAGRLARADVLRNMVQSVEFKSLDLDDLGSSIHRSRFRWVRSLPRARRILDLGGAARGSRTGALVSMGYPYPFEELVIVDLPLTERHSLYAEGHEPLEKVETHLGPVRYVYTSMADLSVFHDEFFDLVHCGQTIEHVTREEAEVVLAEVKRVLKPGGHFCLDTPNRRATRLSSEEFIDPDHKVEYHHEELSAMLVRAGFEIQEAKGFNRMSGCFEANRFDAHEAIKNPGLFDDPTECYILAYRCRKPA